jgi:hypothetical protein
VLKGSELSFINHRLCHSAHRRTVALRKIIVNRGGAPREKDPVPTSDPIDTSGERKPSAAVYLSRNVA